MGQFGFHPTEVKASQVKRPALPRKAKLQDVAKLTPDSRSFTCLVKIVDELREVGADGGDKGKFWEVTCGDATGKVVLSLTEDQKAVAAEKDKLLFVRNAKVRMVQGYIRVIVDKWGKLDTEVGEASVDVGDTNVSATEYEQVKR